MEIQFNDKDKEVIRKIVREEIEKVMFKPIFDKVLSEEAKIITTDQGGQGRKKEKTAEAKEVDENYKKQIKAMEEHSNEDYGKEVII